MSTAEGFSADEVKMLGLREADCGCCVIVDLVGLREFVATGASRR